jgi:hypothetical protein
MLPPPPPPPPWSTTTQPQTRFLISLHTSSENPSTNPKPKTQCDYTTKDSTPDSIAQTRSSEIWKTEPKSFCLKIFCIRKNEVRKEEKEKQSHRSNYPKLPTEPGAQKTCYQNALRSELKRTQEYSAASSSSSEFFRRCKGFIEPRET